MVMQLTGSSGVGKLFDLPKEGYGVYAALLMIRRA